MKKTVSAILCILMLIPFLALADTYSFQQDLAAVERTIQSVLLLEVYNADGDLFATGSGFVAFDSRTLITNYHVIEGAAAIVAISDSGDRYDVTRVLAADKELDIAIMAFKNPTGMAPLALADNAALKRGEPVVTIGSPEGIRNTVAYGNISAFVKWDKYTDIQYTAPISHGSSGGVLLNNAGKVIGVVCAFLEGGQNLNYAIDIDYVTSLFAGITSGGGVPLANYTPSAGESSAQSTQSPETSQSASISGLSAVQTGANAVTLSWTERAAGSFTYFVSYEIDGNPFYTYDSTGETTYIVGGLVPGSLYHFYVGTKGEGTENAELSQSLAIADRGEYTSRGFAPNAFDVYSCDSGADFSTAESIITREIPLADTAGQGRARDYYVALSSRLSASRSMSAGEALYALFTPSGTVYFDSYKYDYPLDASDEYIRYISIDDFFADINQFENSVPVGQYTLALYYDGLSVARTVFSVTDGNPALTAAPTNDVVRELLPPSGITAFADGMAIKLYWTDAEGASKYNLYRSQSAGGIYAAIGASAGGHYTDQSVTPGKTYYYRIESVGEAGVSKRSEPVKVALVSNSPTPVPTKTPRPTATVQSTQSEYLLEVGEDAYVGTPDDPYINPRVNNTSGSTVDSFVLKYYCLDADKNYLLFNNTADYYSEYTYTVSIGPYDYLYPGKVSMSLYGSQVRYVYLAISQVHTTDGETLTVPDPTYFYWELN
jgi:hypothetical protein